MPAMLQQNQLLAAMSQEDTGRFFSGLHPVSLPLRQTIYEVGAPLENVYFIEQGVASLLTTMINGERIEAGMIGSEGVVGLSALLGREISGQQVIVQAPVAALRMTSVDCKAAFDESAGVRIVMLRYAARLLDIAIQTAACNRFHSLKERCARWLLMMFDRLRCDDMPLTHELFSILLGVRRTRVTETAGELQRAGLIRYGRGLVSILDRPRLRATACECYRDHDRLLS